MPFSFHNPFKTFWLSILFLFTFNAYSSNNPKIPNAKPNFLFRENNGQIKNENNSPAILFKAELKGATIFITEKGISYFFINSKKAEPGNRDSVIYNYERMDIELKNANILLSNCNKINPSTTEYNFIYPHCANGIYGVKDYEQLIFKNIYNNIDWILYFNEKGLKYDFIVKPGANANDIKILYRALQPLELINNNITINFNEGKFNEEKPYSFNKNSNAEIKSSYSIKNKLKQNLANVDFYETEIGFTINKYNKNDTLVIDPLQLWWGTYFGGNNDGEGYGVTTDKAGNVFVIGGTNSLNMPVQPYGSLAYFQGTYGGAQNGGGLGDAYILKFTNSGQLLWATYFGGSNTDVGKDIKCDAFGNIFVLGETNSVNFPIKNPGGAFVDSTNGTSDWRADFFIAKFSNTGQHLWATYYGGDDSEYPYALSIDSQNNVYCAGSTRSLNLPCFNPSGGAFFQGTFGTGFSGDDGMILKFSNSCQLLLATYFGGFDHDQIWATDCDSFGNVYFCGKTSSSNLFTQNPGGGAYFQNALPPFSNGNGFILKLNSDCQPIWSTYIGASTGFCTAMACDKSGNVFVTNYVQNGYPTVNPGGGAFFIANSFNSSLVISKFNSNSQMTWSTYFGTWGSTGLLAKINIGGCNEVYVTFQCYVNCPTCPPMQTLNAGANSYFDSTYDNTLNSTYPDIFIAAFTNSGIHRWGTFFGGAGYEGSMIMTCDKSGNLFYTGQQGLNGYQNPAMLQSYTSGCIVNPGGGAYFQNTPLTNYPAGGRYSVIGKFTNPLSNYAFSTDGCGSTNSATIIPSGFGPYTYTWSTGSNSVSINNITQGVYTFTVADTFFGCVETQTVFLGLPSLTINASSTQTAICKGQTTTITAVGANSFSWTPGTNLNSAAGSSVAASPGITTVYTITGYNSPICSSQANYTVNVNQLPVITIAGNDSLCMGSSLNLNASGALNFTWSPTTGINSTTSSSVIANPVTTQTYTIVGQDVNTCIDSIIFALHVIPLPQIQLPANFSVCIGKSATLTATGADQFYWYPNLNLNTATGGQVVTTPATNISYTVVGINGSVCKDSTSISIGIYSKPTLTISTVDSACINNEFQLMVYGNGNFNWSPGFNLNCTQCPNPTATIEHAQYFYVTITDNNLCMNNDSIYVKEARHCDDDIIIPNIFTPNGDGVNDQFYIRNSKNIKQFSIVIYNRWGTKLFESDKIERKWDGHTTSGELVSNGVYMFILNAELLSGRKINKSGTITLIN